MGQIVFTGNTDKPKGFAGLDDLTRLVHAMWAAGGKPKRAVFHSRADIGAMVVQFEQYGQRKRGMFPEDANLLRVCVGPCCMECEIDDTIEPGTVRVEGWVR